MKNAFNILLIVIGFSTQVKAHYILLPSDVSMTNGSITTYHSVQIDIIIPSTIDGANVTSINQPLDEHLQH